MSRRPNPEAREKILKSAHALFYCRGFKGVSMDDVAEASGVKKANLFHYYPSKEALALAVLDYGGIRFKGRVSERFDCCDQDPIRVVSEMFDESIRNMSGSRCRGGCFVGNMAQEISDHSEKMRAKVSECLNFWAGNLSDFLAGAKKRGYFRKELPPRETAEAILSLFEGSVLFSKARRQVDAIENAKKMAVSHLKSFKI